MSPVKSHNGELKILHDIQTFFFNPHVVSSVAQQHGSAAAM